MTNSFIQLVRLFEEHTIAFKEEMQEAFQHGFMATYIADRMAESLGITHKWKVFQGLWNIRNMAQLAGSWKETGKLPPRADEIDELF